MNKQDFLFQLGEALSGLPQGDIEEQLSFYSEMIDDKVENGLTEEAAVAEIGPADRIASQAIADTPLPRLVRERIRTGQRLRACEIILLVLGFPLWFPLMMAGLAILLSGYIVLWALVLSAWTVWVSFAAVSPAAAVTGVFLACRGSVVQGLLMVSSALVLAGLAVFLFFGCRALTRAIWNLTKRIARGTKSLFLRKEYTE